MAKSYSEKLKDPRWQKKRLLILERDNWECTRCQEREKTLNVHHIEYSREPWDTPDDLLTTLCEDCHESIESFKKLSHRLLCSTAGSELEEILKVIEQEDYRTCVLSEVCHNEKLCHAFYCIIEQLEKYRIEGFKRGKGMVA